MLRHWRSSSDALSRTRKAATLKERTEGLRRNGGVGPKMPWFHAGEAWAIAGVGRAIAIGIEMLYQ